MVDAIGPYLSLDTDTVLRRIDEVADDRVRGRVRALCQATLALVRGTKNIEVRLLRQSDVGRVRPAELWRRLSADFTGLWTTLERYEQQMLDIGEGQDADGAGEAEGMQRQGPEGGIEPGVFSSAGGDPSQPSLRTPEDRVIAGARATGVVLRAETAKLRESIPTLTAAVSCWDLVAAVQGYLAAITTTAEGLLTCIYASLPPAVGEDAEAERDRELTVALRTRREFVALLREVEPTVQELQSRPVGEWESGLRYLYLTLDRFVFGPAFPWMRAVDKGRLVEWVRGLEQLLSLWSPLRREHAENALAALISFMSGLQDINQRQCLREHDITMLERALADLNEVNPSSPPGGAAGDVGVAIASLKRVEGRDPDLESLIEQALSPSSPLPLRKLKAQVATVLERVRRCPEVEEDGP